AHAARDEEVGSGLRDVALGDSAQADPHAGSLEVGGMRGAIEEQMAMVDEGALPLHLLGRRQSRRLAVEFPERRKRGPGRVERARGEMRRLLCRRRTSSNSGGTSTGAIPALSLMREVALRGSHSERMPARRSISANA